MPEATAQVREGGAEMTGTHHLAPHRPSTRPALPHACRGPPPSSSTPTDMCPRFFLSRHQSEQISSVFPFPTCNNLGYTRVMFMPPGGHLE